MSDMDLATALLRLEQLQIENVELRAHVARLQGQVDRLSVAAGLTTGSGKTQPAPPPAKARPRDSKATT